MDPEIKLFVVFAAVNEILPDPDAARPIAVLVFVHVYDDVPAPPLVVVNETAPVLPAQNVWVPGLFTCPVGLIYIVNVLVDPTQLVPPFVNVGVTTMTPDIGAVPALVAENEMFPVPLAASPIAVLVFVHE